jgi:hypothetical protein
MNATATQSRSVSERQQTRAEGSAFPGLEEALQALQVALRPNDILIALQAIGLDSTDLAEGIGADERTVRRWLDGQSPNRNHEQTIGALRVLAIHILQRRGLAVDLIAHWLRLPDGDLDCKTPLATIAEGRLAEAMGGFDVYIAPKPGSASNVDANRRGSGDDGDEVETDDREPTAEFSTVPVA